MTMQEFFATPTFGLALSFAAYGFGAYVQQKTRKPIFNPLLIAAILVISFLMVFHIPLQSYTKGGDIISLFLAPATASLGLNVYRQRKLIKERFLVIISATFVGASSCIAFIYFGGKLLGLDKVYINTLIPKSITTPFAMAVSESIGGIPSLTIAAVILSGMVGAFLFPQLCRVCHFDDPVSQGLAIGTCSHAIGTSRATEEGEEQGALSSVALTLTGIITVILSLILFH